MKRRLCLGMMMSMGMIAEAASAETFSTAPAITNPGGPGELTVYAARSSNGILARRKRVNWSWDNWTDYAPAGGGSTAGVTAGTEVAAVTTISPTSVKGSDAVCIRARGVDQKPDVFCSFPFIQGGNWIQTGYDLTVSPALAAYAGLVLEYKVRNDGVLIVSSYQVANGGGASGVVVPGAPQGFTGIAAVALSAGPNPGWVEICGRLSDQYWCTVTNQYSTPTTWTQAPGSYGSRPALGAGQIFNGYYPQILGVASWETQGWETHNVFGWTNPTPIGGDLGSALTLVGTGGFTFDACALAHWDNSMWCTYTTDGVNWGGWYPI